MTKYHLRDYSRSAGLVDSAVDLYQEQELQRQGGEFFDKAICYTVRSYERAANHKEATGAVERAR